MLSLDITHTQQCLFQASFLSRVNFPPKLTIPSRQTDARLSALNLFFFGWGNELQIYHGNFLLMDNRRRKY